MKLSSFFVGATFDTNIVNGAVQPRLQILSESTRKTKYKPIKFSTNPAADIRDSATIDGPDSRCNQGAFASAERTSVLTVNAGDGIRLRLAANTIFQHPGPGLVYLSRAPNDNITAYDGPGDWFKIHHEGVCNENIPKNTRNGEYLARFEHFGTGKPDPTGKFPGTYKASDPHASFNIYNGYKGFPRPGPAVWSS
ncbi:lytic polysaccharide monooxygenase [Parathielavia appendiculata]|uniref:lytic cellulose monooxygenase (C4-dehydrogenating) n=1 Tax=Parathielavia appendiculata TaxID=2587402 RepID=A0AAN6TVF6_9PEZI|nr:lytic polysaccharide monooxygenase [Parathielavia appendiculata]